MTQTVTATAAEPDYVVTNKAQMIVALQDAAKTTFDEARGSPFSVRWESTLFTFGEGLHVARAKEIITNIKRNAKKWVNK